MECNRQAAVEQLRRRGCAMRLAFWRAGTAKALVEKVLAGPAPAVARQIADLPSGDLDLRALGQVLMRNRGLIVAPTMLAAVIAIMAVNLVTPRYRSEARILIDGRENVFLRPNGERNEERTALDAEAVNKQRHAQHRDRKRQQGAEQVPPGVARDARPRPGPAIARHGSHAATSASRSISPRRRA